MFFHLKTTIHKTTNPPRNPIRIIKVPTITVCNIYLFERLGKGKLQEGRVENMHKGSYILGSGVSVF